MPTRLFSGISPSSIIVYQWNKKIKGDRPHFDEKVEGYFSLLASV
jgi:hypothetical protein